MPYSITTKDGITIQNIPDNVAADSQVLKDRVAAIRAQASGTSDQISPAPTQPQRSGMDAAARQVGLTARHSIEGAAQYAGMVTDPIISAFGGAVRAVTGSDYDPVTLSKIGQHVANTLGLPEPENSLERVVGAIARGATGATALSGIAKQVAGATTGTTRAVAQQVAAQPGLQATAAGAAGAAGQSVAEGGGTPGEQLAAALAAGIASPAAAAGAGKLAGLRNAKIAPEQQAILDAGKKANIPVLTTDVLPPKTFVGKQAQAVGESIPVAGTGPARQVQQEARQQAVSDLAQRYGAPSYEAIVASVKGKVGNIKAAAGRVIDKAGQELDSAGSVTPSKSVQAIDDAIAALNRPNVYNPGAARQIDELANLKTVLSGGQQTFTTLRQSRTAVREMLDSVDAAGRSQMPSYTKRLVTGVYSAMKDDMDDFARATLSPAKFEKLARANRVYGNEAQLLKSSRLKGVLDKGDLTPEVVRNLIYSNKPSENRILYDALSAPGRQQVKAALIDDAATKALRNGEINPNAFGTELAKHDKKIDIFFHGAERDAVKGMVRLMQVTRRAQDAAVAPTNGARLTPWAMGASAIYDLGATLTAAVTAGRLARIYESAPVRNLLLKLANVKAGSSREASYVRALAATLREAAPEQEGRRRLPAMPAALEAPRERPTPLLLPAPTLVPVNQPTK